MNENENENDNIKIIFAKPTTENFCAIVAYKDVDFLKVCDIIESENITDFINELIELAKKHNPELVNYECSIYLSECNAFRNHLAEHDIKVRCYKSFGTYIERIISQSEWIRDNVLVNEKYENFIDNIASYSPIENDRCNIAMDVLSDATQYFRKYYFAYG